ncbi:MAG: heme-binding protein [Phycisphaerae bacterium]|nr:heme-binding protein [Phycisphaerae bacterium]
MFAHVRISALATAAAFVGSLGCASADSRTGARQSLGDGSRTMGKPFVIREASLPEGFPGPGPVGEVIMKDYPAYRLARMTSKAEGVSGGSDGMFRPLFNHIKRNKIPMTAPVEMGYPAEPAELASLTGQTKGMRSAESMAFLYGDPSWGRLGADPSDRRVEVEDVPAMTVLSVGVRGSYTDGKFAAALKTLHEWVAANPRRVKVVGPPRYLGYNSPFVLWFLRYAEVQLPVERIEALAETVATK